MATRTRERTALADEDVQRLLALVKDADTVELKLTVPATDHRATVLGLGLDPLQAEIRQVYFFDTPELTLDAQGLVVRARRSQRKGDDTVVKLRPVVPSELPKAVRRSPAFGVEVDASPGGFVCSGSMKGAPETGRVHEAMSGRGRIRSLFSGEQRKLFAAHAPDGLELDDLEILGPLFVLKLKYAPEGLPRKLVVEMWLYPDGSRILELSTKCTPAEPFQVAAETRAYLSGRGVPLDGDQQTKTRTALTYFAEQLSATPAAKASSPAAKSGSPAAKAKTGSRAAKAG